MTNVPGAWAWHFLPCCLKGFRAYSFITCQFQNRSTVCKDIEWCCSMTWMECMIFILIGDIYISQKVERDWPLGVISRYMYLTFFLHAWMEELHRIPACLSQSLWKLHRIPACLSQSLCNPSVKSIGSCNFSWNNLLAHKK